MELYGPTQSKTVKKSKICHQVIGKFPIKMFTKCLSTMEPSYLSLIKGQALSVNNREYT